MSKQAGISKALDKPNFQEVALAEQIPVASRLLWPVEAAENTEGVSSLYWYTVRPGEEDSFTHKSLGECILDVILTAFEVLGGYHCHEDAQGIHANCGSERIKIIFAILLGEPSSDKPCLVSLERAIRVGLDCEHPLRRHVIHSLGRRLFDPSSVCVQGSDFLLDCFAPFFSMLQIVNSLIVCLRQGNGDLPSGGHERDILFDSGFHLEFIDPMSDQCSDPLVLTLHCLSVVIGIPRSLCCRRVSVLRISQVGLRQSPGRTSNRLLGSYLHWHLFHLSCGR